MLVESTSVQPFAVRVASLLPAATEIVAALDAEELLVGVSHECDYPHSTAVLPRLTWSSVDRNGTSAAIDRQVRALRERGRPVIPVNGNILRAVRPSLVLTQDLCEVCAVVDGDLRSLAETISPVPVVLSLSARTLSGIFGDIRAVGRALRRELAADTIVTGLEARRTVLAAFPPTRPPRTLVIEWLDPLFLAGHWVPEMVEAAGGRDVGATPGSHSIARSWDALRDLAPDLVIVALCGFDLERGVEEWQRFLESDSEEAGVARRLDVPVWALDGNAYTSRPGPRVIDGIELLKSAMAGTAVSGLVRLR